MKAKAHLDDAAQLTLTFKDGMADRNRLPFDQIVDTLIELRELVREIGKGIQIQNGAEKADGDFGLELVTSASSNIFRKGSVKAQIVPTRDLENAKKTLTLIVDNTVRLESGKRVVASVGDDAYFRRMSRVAKLQQPAHNSLVLQMKSSNAKTATASLTQRGYERLQQAHQRPVRIENQLVYGRLLMLRDRSRSDEDQEHVWGHLLTDNGEVWRLRLPSSRVQDASALFRKHVVVEGTAVYYDVVSPRLNVTSLTLDPPRDYLAAFDLVTSRSEPLFGEVSARELLEELYI